MIQSKGKVIQYTENDGLSIQDLGVHIGVHTKYYSIKIDTNQYEYSTHQEDT